jgi:hypothetical protein
MQRDILAEKFGAFIEDFNSLYIDESKGAICVCCFMSSVVKK